MSKFTKEELIALREEWIELCKIEIDYSKYRVTEKRRQVMIKRADDITYRKKNKRMSEIICMFKDELMAYAKRPKDVDENGKVTFLDE